MRFQIRSCFRMMSIISGRTAFIYSKAGIRLRWLKYSPDNKKQTDIYYEPGYHYAKLLGDEKVLKEIPVHIKYNDWYVRFRYPNSELVQVKEADLHTTGYLGVTTDYLRAFQAIGCKISDGLYVVQRFQFPGR